MLLWICYLDISDRIAYINLSGPNRDIWHLKVDVEYVLSEHTPENISLGLHTDNQASWRVTVSIGDTSLSHPIKSANSSIKYWKEFNCVAILSLSCENTCSLALGS